MTSRFKKTLYGLDEVVRFTIPYNFSIYIPINTFDFCGVLKKYTNISVNHTQVFKSCV